MSKMVRKEIEVPWAGQMISVSHNLEICADDLDWGLVQEWCKTKNERNWRAEIIDALGHVCNHDLDFNDVLNYMEDASLNEWATILEMGRNGEEDLPPEFIGLALLQEAYLTNKFSLFDCIEFLKEKKEDLGLHKKLFSHLN